jgi:hypothetical protein|tara:strand:+ start:333 stop:512 length:180 start_codon:yes stop_codon:yes gene_type:complete
MFKIFLNAFFLLPSSRQADPMQNRVDPAAFAARAASITASTFMVGVGFTKVLCFTDWLQ